MLRAEVYLRTLFGLPLADGRDADTTVAGAVETMLRAYGTGRAQAVSPPCDAPSCRP